MKSLKQTILNYKVHTALWMPVQDDPVSPSSGDPVIFSESHRFSDLFFKNILPIGSNKKINWRS